MVSLEGVREIALAFEAAEEVPHFEITSFRVKKKIFVTMNSEMNHITIRLSEVDQSVFYEYSPEVIYPVPNKWGKYGWTHVNLLLVEKELLREVIRLSYRIAAPNKLAALYNSEE
ncbi:MAG: hypothetical protein RLZZ519_2940 [Bacteroidota bacterium]|jgi:hypothetical protein